MDRGKSFDLATLPGAEILGYGVQKSIDLIQTPRDTQSQRQTFSHPPDPLEYTSPHGSAPSSLLAIGLEATAARSTRSSTKHTRELDEGPLNQTSKEERETHQSSGSVDTVRTGEGLGAADGRDLAKDSPADRSNTHQPLTQDTPRASTALIQEPLKSQDETRSNTEQPSVASKEGSRTSLVPTQPSSTSGANASTSISTPTEDQVVSLKAKTEQRAPVADKSRAEKASRPSDTLKTSTDLPSQYLYGNIDSQTSIADIANFGGHGDSNQDVLPSTRQGLDDESPMLPRTGFREHLVNGISTESPRDLTLSRRPPMQIDTRFSSNVDAAKQGSGSATSAAGPNVAQSAIANKQVQTPASAQSPPERMTTRTTSGALRHKSVSEIMGEVPRMSSNHSDRTNNDTHQDESAIAQTPKSATSFVSPDSAAFKLRLNEMREKEKSSKLSTVVFAKPQASGASGRVESSPSQQVDVKRKPVEDRDYFLTMFVNHCYSQAPNQRVDRQPLTSLIKSAHKTLSTSDLYVDFRERQDTRVLHRIRNLQEANKWSLRQPERSDEPERQTTHWDVLLGQVKWMRTDFREERKWKAAAAKFLAEACAQWNSSSPDKRKLLQVRLKALEPRPKSRSNSVSQSAPTPDLVYSLDDETSEAMDEDPLCPHGEPPAAIFSLPPDMFIFGLNKSPISDKILQELPLYQPSAESQEGTLDANALSPDASWKTPIVPISKYAQGKIVRQEGEPPRKRSRLQYEDNDEPEQAGPVLQRENQDVALFDPEHKHIRDRIHTGHAFRPPTEHNMPSQAFFETRLPSQWTLAEDDELRRLVREYAYNWSLISNCLSSPSSFSSGAERRTPWECFERWVTLEGLPAEMSKVNYFRAYHARLQAAARTYEAQQQLLIQQHPNAAQLPRRRTTQPYTVDRRKNHKHIHLIDAIRKLAKKRETKMLKDQHCMFSHHDLSLLLLTV